jgi:hypothetical protein
MRYNHRRAGCNHPATLVSRARADIDHPVATRYHPHVVLYSDHRVTCLNQPVQFA